MKFGDGDRFGLLSSFKQGSIFEHGFSGAGNETHAGLVIGN